MNIIKLFIPDEYGKGFGDHYFIFNPSQRKKDDESPLIPQRFMRFLPPKKYLCDMNQSELRDWNNNQRLRDLEKELSLWRDNQFRY